MSSIITLDAAREHLRVEDEASDTQIRDLLATAEQLVADHMGRDGLIGPEGWSETSIPAPIVHAVKLVLADLYQNRVTPLDDLTGVNALVGRYSRIGFA